MSRKKSLLSDVLEELKTYKRGILLDKRISIYNDEDSEIKSAMLSRLNPKEFSTYKVVHYYQKIFNPEVIEIYVIKE